MYLEPLAALLSKKTGKPVKMTMTRDEVFDATGPTSGTYIRVKLGAKKDGTLTAGEAYMAYEAGAFPGSPVGGGMNGVFAPYDIPNFVRSTATTSSSTSPRPPPTARPARRRACSPASPRSTSSPTQLGMDPLDLRIKNAVEGGRQRVPWAASGATIGNVETMLAMKNSPHYKSELQGDNKGRGVSMGFWGNAGLETSSSASRQPDGTVQLVLG